jgi:hypothetical protein
MNIKSASCKCHFFARKRRLAQCPRTLYGGVVIAGEIVILTKKRKNFKDRSTGVEPERVFASSATYFDLRSSSRRAEKLL